MSVRPHVDFARVQELFSELVDIPRGERSGRLNALTEDEDIRREVFELLHASDDTRPFLDSAAELPADLGETDRVESGRRVGSFTLGRRIGVGGMGVVYEAVQDRPQRVVAVKLIRSELATDEGIERFRREAELLGRLQHPGIATIFEAGTQDDPDDPAAPKLPYCAMELVVGERITAWADVRRLSLDERVELMARVCDAVDHAHRRGVIHRDLKPANVLVTDEGLPKVLDFGVARAIGSAATALGEGRTVAGSLVGTLGWMSPEQVRGTLDDVDARSDVYALGAIAYELFGGRPPFDLDGLSIAEAIHRLCEVDPSPLERIRPDVPRDLSVVVAKAVLKEKGGRYASAAAFADDLRACHDRRPIAARPATALYRMHRFAARNRLAVAIGCGALLLLVASAAIAALGWRSASLGAERTRQVNESLLSMIRTLNPNEMGSSDITLKQTLDEIRERVSKEVEGTPDLAASVHEALGQQYLEIGYLDDAERHLRLACELRKACFGTDSLPVIESESLLGTCLRRQDRAEEAVPLLEHALARRRATDAEPGIVAEALNNLGAAYYSADRLDDARRCFREGLVLLEAQPEELLGRAHLLSNLAMVHMSASDFGRAAETGNEAVRTLVALGESDGASQILSQLGMVLLHAGDAELREAAADMLNRAYQLDVQRLPADHPSLCRVRDAISRHCHSLGESGRARTLALENVRAIQAGGRTTPQDQYHAIALALLVHDPGAHPEVFAEFQPILDDLVANQGAKPQPNRLRRRD